MRKVYERRFLALLAATAIILSTNPVVSCGRSQESAEIKTIKGIWLFEASKGKCVFEESKGYREMPSLEAQRIYWKASGQQRTEFLRVPEGVDFEKFEDRADLPVDQIVLTWRKGDKLFETRLNPEWQKAAHTKYTVPEQEEEEVTIDLKDRTLGFSEQLKAYLKSEDKESIGKRSIDGFEAEGYRVEVTDVPELTSGTLTVTLWQECERGFPLEMTMVGEEVSSDKHFFRLATIRIPVFL